MDPNEFVPALQEETARLIGGLLADMAAKDVAITQLQARVAELEEQNALLEQKLAG